MQNGRTRERAWWLGMTCAALVAACGGSPPTGTGGTGGTGGTAGSAGNAGSGGSGASPGVTRRIESAGSYLGTVNGAAGCAREYTLHGFEPVSGARHPLFLYFTGTNFVLSEDAFRVTAAPGVDAVTEAMARRGYVALWVEYDNTPGAWASDHVALLECLFGSGERSVLSVACALPSVDCDLGIATWGHSLGALTAHRAHDFEPRVGATWTAGYGGDPRATLAKDRLRVVNGEGDYFGNGTVPVLNKVAGFSDGECPDDGRNDCLRADGSGWIRVTKGACQISSADHCWFDRKSCLDDAAALEPNWVERSSPQPFALEPNADWLASAMQRSD